MIAQAIIESSKEDNDLNFVGAVKEYIGVKEDTRYVLNKYVKEINGMTNLFPEEIKEVLRNISQKYNEKGENLEQIKFSTADGIGIKNIAVINLSNFDITKPNEIVRVFSEITTYNSNNATSRGNMASAIMDILNYGNTNTNNMTTQEWLNKIGDDGIAYGNSLFDKTWDTVTNNRISFLDVRLQNPVADFINSVQQRKGVLLRVAEGYRTFERQAELYSKGRDINGNVINRKNIVTNAKPGQTYHNYGLAVDMYIIKGNKVLPITNSIANFGIQNYGFTWGGNFRSIKDPPHFEMNFDKNWRYYINNKILQDEVNKK